MTTLATLASDVPGGASAVDAIRSKLREFEAAESKIRVLQHRAAVLAGQATTQGRTADAANLRAQILRLGTLAQKAGETRDKIAPVLNWLKQQGFGAVFIPVIIAAAAVSAAVGIAYVIKQSGVEEQQLDLVARGILTPDQYAALQKEAPRGLLNINLGNTALWLGVGVLAYLFLTGRLGGKRAA